MVSLGDVAENSLFVDGDWVESKDQDPTGDIRLTQLADVGVGRFRNRSDRWLRSDQADRLNCTYLRGGDVLIARMPDPIGRACLVPTFDYPAVTVVDVAILRPSPDFNPRYVMWMINAPQFHEAVVSKQSGTTRKRISRKNLATLTIPRRKTSEQRRIVEIIEEHLSHLDAADASLTLASRRAERMLSAGLWAATHDLPESRRLRLDEIANVRLGRQRSPKNHAGDRMRPYLRAANVDWDRLRLEDVKTMNFTEAEEDVYRLEFGDILLTEASGSPAEVGKSVLYGGHPENVCFQNTLLRVRPHEGNAHFIQKFLLAEALTGRFMPDSRGVGINHLGRTRLAALTIDLPSPEQQLAAIDRCHQIVETVGQLREAHNRASQRSAALRRAVLAAAFSGRLNGAASDTSAIIQEFTYAE